MKNYKIAVAGTGYVGLSLGVLLSQHHQVVAVDIVQAKVDMINNKKSPIQDDYIEKYLAEKDLNLTATLDAKVALAVCYDTKNFGSQLQVLATVKKVEELDCKSEIIRYKKKITPTFIVQTIPRLFNISFVKSKLSGNQKDNALKSKPFYQAQVQQRNQRFDAFVDKYFAPLFSESYGGWETLVAKCKKNYDAFLCGSDQLWLPNNLGSHFYTLEFAPDNKTKVAYATSFGVSQIPNSQKKATAKYLNRFQHLSTRELAGQKIIKELTGKTAQVVCDPTLLFDAEGWKQMLPEKKVVEEPYVFCYFLGTNL